MQLIYVDFFFLRAGCMLAIFVNAAHLCGFLFFVCWLYASYICKCSSFMWLSFLFACCIQVIFVNASHVCGFLVW